jgi:uracil-DNA glycosylase
VGSPLVVALGRVALHALDRIEPHALELGRDVGQVCSWGGRALVPLYHPSRQSTLHRADAAQQDDWRRLGAVAAALRQPRR